MRGPTDSINSHSCPACTKMDLGEIISISGLPVFSNILHVCRQDALNAPKGDIYLLYCRSCGHLFNDAFNPKLVEYKGEYENSLHYSGFFQDYARNLACDLIARHDLHKKNVIEIGCGQGDFLSLLCRMGGNKGLGYDPGYVPERRDLLQKVDATIVADYWKYEAGMEADMVICRHVLEHIPDPLEWLRRMREAIGRRETHLYFEVPNAGFTIQGMGIWDLIYEHCGYFTPKSLVQVFLQAGFDIQAVESVYGGQFLGLHAQAGSQPKREIHEVRIESEMVTSLDRFALAYRQKIQGWRTRLQDLRASGKRVMLWGAGSKAVSFVNILKPGVEVEALIDLNPHKHGRFIPGTGHQVLDPSSLVSKAPDVFLVMNPLYRDEIAAYISRLGLVSTIIVDGLI